MADKNNESFHRPKSLEVELITVGLVLILGHILGSFYDWYDNYFFSDIIVHFAGGAWVAFAAFAFIPSLRGTSFKRSALSLVLIVFAAAVAWEIFEFAIERRYSVDFQGPPLDTLSDLIIGTLGGASAAIYVKSRD